MAAKWHLGNGGEVPHTVSACVSVNRSFGDKNRFGISDVGRDDLHLCGVQMGCIQYHPGRISSAGSCGKGGITTYV